MKHNVGSIDKSMRIVVGLAIIGAGFYFGSWWGAVGLVPLLTGLTGFCALYSLFGINTCRIKS